uniref:hypothetical protein n=1 Tax=Gelidibacter sp. TaxID=2018083 RepID=UPI00404B5137
MQFNFNDKIIIVGGTVFSVLPNIRPDDLIVTVIMAFTGAFASFVASMLLKFLAKKLFKREINSK